MDREKKGVPPVKTGTNRRDFLKKMALGTACAVPVMTTFSLDSVRSKAHAQGNYGNPRVISFTARPASGSFAADPRIQADAIPQAFYEISWDRPMDKDYNMAKSCTPIPPPPPCGGDAVVAPPRESQLIAGCGNCFEPWTWNAAGTKETYPIYGSTAIHLEINGADCTNGVVPKKYRDLNGVIAGRFSGSAGWCGPT